MRILRLELGLTKCNEFTGVEEHVSRTGWSAHELPTKGIFFSHVLDLFQAVELPWFPGTAWVTVQTATTTMRGGTEGDTEDPEHVADRLWTYIGAVRDGLL